MLKLALVMKTAGPCIQHVALHTGWPVTVSGAEFIYYLQFNEE